MLFSYAPSPALVPVFWGVGGLFAVVGFVALVSPKHFAALGRFGNRWIDTSAVLSKLDRRVDVDDRLLPYSRFLGASVLLALGAAWAVTQR
jgi:hypothetical protein